MLEKKRAEISGSDKIRDSMGRVKCDFYPDSDDGLLTGLIENIGRYATTWSRTVSWFFVPLLFLLSSHFFRLMLSRIITLILLS